MATRANLFVDQGSDFISQVELENATSDKMDLQDITFTGQVRKSAYSVNAYDFYIDKVANVDGVIRISIDSSVTESMKGGIYVYDIYGHDSTTGTTFKALEGMLEVIPQVTRANSNG